MGSGKTEVENGESDVFGSDVRNVRVVVTLDGR
jgi:hypothetical protein